MSTKRKSESIRFLESLSGRPLTLGGLLESIRKAEELTQIEFAEMLDISPSHLCDIEKGRKVISLERAVRFADLLERSQEQFVKLALQEQLDNAGINMKIKVQAA